MMLLSKKIKTTALYYFRYERNVPLVATEAGPHNSDVVAISAAEAIEVEIKVDKQDLKREFTSKTRKHSGYTMDLGRGGWDIPNKFYFLVPEELKEEAIQLCMEASKNPKFKNASKYGVLVYHPRLRKERDSPFGWIEVGKKAFRLHNEKPANRFLDIILNRSSSELVRSYLENEWQTIEMENLKNELEKYRLREDKTDRTSSGTSGGCADGTEDDPEGTAQSVV